MSSAAGTVTTWILGTAAVAGGTFVVVQQMTSEPEPVIEITPPPAIEAPVIEIKEPPVAEIVRINNGLATIAGEGNPGEEIVVMQDNQVVARTTIASDGTFAIVFEYEPPKQGAILELGEESADGELLKAEKSIAILPKYGEKPVVASLDEDMIKIEVDNREQFKFAGVVYGEGEEATISGYSTPNTKITVFLNGDSVAEIDTGDSGQWRYLLASVPEGKHKLKFLTNDEQVLETELDRVPTVQTAIVQAGDSLWRIAESALGDGYRYVDIYNLNAEKITNPDLIYPDQEIIIKQRQ